VKRTVLTVILSLLLVFSLSAFSGSGKMYTGENETSLIVIGPGDPLYSYWGHIGINIDGTFYDFGNFSFDEDNFYRNFAMGRLWYLGMASSTPLVVSYTIRENRDVKVYPLNLGIEEKKILENKLEWWVQPENRRYLYDYFLNNCSTIIRDVLNDATNGQLKEFSSGFPDKTFRFYARTGCAPSAFNEILLDYLLGVPEDVPITGWEKMFMPQSVADFAQIFTYTDSSGIKRKLAEKEILINKSTRPPVPDKYRTLWPWMLIAGLFSGILWRIISIISVSEKRFIFTTGNTIRILIILIIGIFGLFLGFAMTFTDHNSVTGNINLWPSFPTMLTALIPLFMIFRKKNSSKEKRMKLEKTASVILTINFAGFLLAVFLRLSGLFIQDAFAFWAFFAPFTFLTSIAGFSIQNRYLRNLPAHW